ncbi:MAG: hypothetical protein ACK4GG_05330, partial [Sphingomonas sp.]
MTDHMTIDHEVGKRITAADECALVMAAYARNPTSELLRDRLAVLFNRNDRFAEAMTEIQTLNETYGPRVAGESDTTARAAMQQEMTTEMTAAVTRS